MKGSLATIKNLLEIIKMVAITVTNMDWSLISNLKVAIKINRRKTKE
jgi:hypothetical protein